MPPNQFMYVRCVTPGTCRMRCTYDSGSGLVSEMALRVTTRSAAEASLDEYQAVSTVRRNRNATTESTTPSVVKTERVLLRRNALRSAIPVSVTCAAPCRGGGAPWPL